MYYLERLCSQRAFDSEVGPDSCRKRGLCYPDRVSVGSVSAELLTAFRHSLALSPSLWSNLSSSRVRRSPLPILFLSVDIVISSSSIGYPDSSIEWRRDRASFSPAPTSHLSALPISAVILLGPIETGLKARMSVIAPVRSDEFLRDGVTFIPIDTRSASPIESKWTIPPLTPSNFTRPTVIGKTVSAPDLSLLTEVKL